MMLKQVFCYHDYPDDDDDDNKTVLAVNGKNITIKYCRRCKKRKVVNEK